MLALSTWGCAPTESKPSYADLVVIYNAEAQELDRLEHKRADMVAEYEATLQPSEEDALQAIAGALGGIGEATGDGPKLDATDPNELLDQAIASAESVGAQTDALLEAAAKQAGNRSANRESIAALYSDEFKAKLAELDSQIASQRKRVEKARAARDAAENE
jgi:hypothetical protein